MSPPTPAAAGLGIAGDPELLAAVCGKAGGPRAETKGSMCINTISFRPEHGAARSRGRRPLREPGGGGDGGAPAAPGRESPAKAWCELCLPGIMAYHVLQKMGGGEGRNDAQIPSPTPLCSWVTNHLRCINHLFLLVSRGKISLMLLQLPFSPPLPSLQIYFLAQSVSSNHN